MSIRRTRTINRFHIQFSKTCAALAAGGAIPPEPLYTDVKHVSATPGRTSADKGLATNGLGATEFISEGRERPAATSQAATEVHEMKNGVER